MNKQFASEYRTFWYILLSCYHQRVVVSECDDQTEPEITIAQFIPAPFLSLTVF